MSMVYIFHQYMHHPLNQKSSGNTLQMFKATILFCHLSLLPLNNRSFGSVCIFDFMLCQNALDRKCSSSKKNCKACKVLLHISLNLPKSYTTKNTFIFPQRVYIIIVLLLYELTLKVYQDVHYITLTEN